MELAASDAPSFASVPSFFKKNISCFSLNDLSRNGYLCRATGSRGTCWGTSPKITRTMFPFDSICSIDQTESNEFQRYRLSPFCCRVLAFVFCGFFFHWFVSNENGCQHRKAASQRQRFVYSMNWKWATKREMRHQTTRMCAEWSQFQWMKRTVDELF